MAMPVPRVDLNLLVSLDVLLAECHVTRAASRLGLSQPALSAQLRQLREAFGDPLLVPGPKGMTLTSRALALKAPLRELLAGFHGLISAGQTFDPLTARQVFRVAATDSIHSSVTTLLATRLATLAPQCQLAMQRADLQTLPEQLASGEMDLALLTPQATPATLHARKLYDETFLCVMRQGHPAASQPMDLDTFCSLAHVLVSPSGGGFIGAVDEALLALGRSRRVQISVNSFLLVPGLVEGTDLIATVPARLARHWEGLLAVVSVPLAVPGFSVSMAWHPRAHVDPSQIWLRDTLRHAVATRPRRSNDNGFCVGDRKGKPMDGPSRSMPWDEIQKRVGSSFGTSDWVVITQSMISAFADATDDHYFLHVDPERAGATPFKGTIAHGLLTLSLLPALGYQVCPYIEGARYPLNYGFDKVRFVAPVPVGSRVRACFALRQAETIRADQRQLLYDATVEIEGSERPALVAEWLMRYVV